MDIYKELLDYPDEYKDEMKINKTDLYQKGGLKTKDKNIIQKNIELISLKYYFSQETTNIPNFHNELYNYYEVDLVEIILRKNKKINRIADILFRNIPRPSLLFFRYNDCLKIYASHIRSHGSDNSKKTYDDEKGLIKTEWIDLNNINENEKNLFNNLKLKNISTMNFYKFYDDMYNSIIKYKTGLIKKNPKNINTNKQKIILDKIELLENEINLLTKERKKTAYFRDKVEINNKIIQYQKEKTQLIEEL